MANMDFYSRGDRVFVRLNRILEGMFTLSTLYPFVYIASLSLSSGFEACAGNVILTPIDQPISAFQRVLSERLF